MRPDVWLANAVRQSPGKTAFLVVLVLIIGGWSIYARLTADGIIRGRVVDESGDPVANATVELREKTLNYSYPPEVTETNGDGVFVYEEMALIEFTIRARKEGYGRSEQKRYHLDFKRQHFELPEPLVLGRAE